MFFLGRCEVRGVVVACVCFAGRVEDGDGFVGVGRGFYGGYGEDAVEYVEESVCFCCGECLRQLGFGA